MSVQLNLTGDLPVPPDVPLTERQRLALEYVAQHQPVPSDELGALLHEERQSRGGRGHPRDQRCAWDNDEGKAMGGALRRKGLVKMRRDQGWVLASWTPAASEDGYDPRTSDWPDGF